MDKRKDLMDYMNEIIELMQSDAVSTFELEEIARAVRSLVDLALIQGRIEGSESAQEHIARALSGTQKPSSVDASPRPPLPCDVGLAPEDRFPVLPPVETQHESDQPKSHAPRAQSLVRNVRTFSFVLVALLVSLFAGLYAIGYNFEPILYYAHSVARGQPVQTCADLPDHLISLYEKCNGAALIAE